MELNYTERTECTREYVLELDVEEFVEWLEGATPTRELLNDFISVMVLPYAEIETEDEYTIETGIDIDELDEFLESVDEYIEELEEEE